MADREAIIEETVPISSPEEPSSSYHVDLAAIDAFHPIHYSRRLLFFRCSSPSQFTTQLGLLKTALEALVRRFPVLNGVVIPDESHLGKCSIQGGPAAELVVKDLRNILPSFEEFETANFPTQPLKFELLVPVPEDISNDRSYPAFKVQFSAINGGSILAFAMSHSVADGLGTDEFLKILAEETRLAQDSSNENRSTKIQAEISPIGLDRSVLRNMTSQKEFDIKDHPAYRWATTPEPANIAHPFDPTTPEETVVLKIPPAKLAQLKADATPPGKQISTHDALAGLIWRSKMICHSRRSLVAPPPGPSKFFMPSDGRKHVGLPQNYIGNSVYQIYAELPLPTVLSATGLQSCAYAIRKALIAATPDVVQSFMAFYNNNIKDPTSIGWQFTVPGAMAIGVPMGTDWKSTDAVYADLGDAFGDVVSYRFPGGPGNNVVLPKLHDGSAEVAVSVMPQEVGLLKSEECFGRYLA